LMRQTVRTAVELARDQASQHQHSVTVKRR
jgi:hypothetical protein